MSHAFLVHPEAALDYIEASEWYESRSTKAAARFDEEVRRAFVKIAEAPDRWPRHDAEHRHFVLRGFPYIVIYLEAPSGPVVLAVAHASRREDYWRDRRVENGV